MPQVKTITVYTINELSDKAKDKAHNNWVSSDNIAWAQENFKTLKVFAEAFNIEIKEAYYGGRGEGVTWYFNGREEVLSLCGIRLLAYIENNIGPKIRKPKWMHKGAIGGKIISRYSKCQTDIAGPFTGYYMDMCLLDPVLKFIKNPANSITFEDLVNDCTNEWIKACNADVDYQNSMEAFIESCEANEYTFTEFGDMENI